MNETWHAVRNNKPLLASILMVTVALLLWLIERLLPQYPYYNREFVVYPLLAIFGNPVFFVLIPAVYLGTILFILSKMRDLRSCLATIFLVSLPLVACALLTATIFLRPGFHHETSVAFEGKVYHVALSYGAEPGWDYNVYVYIVYECDGLGIMCKNILTPVSESYWSADVPSYHTGFSSDGDNNTLYVEIGGDRYAVRS